MWTLFNNYLCGNLYESVKNVNKAVQEILYPEKKYVTI